MAINQIKTATYGVMHFIVAVVVAFAVTRSWAAAIGVGVIEPLIQTVAYTLHEKAWSRQAIGPRFVQPA